MELSEESVIPVLQMENWDKESLPDLPKVKQETWSKAGIRA